MLITLLQWFSSQEEVPGGDLAVAERCSDGGADQPLQLRRPRHVLPLQTLRPSHCRTGSSNTVLSLVDNLTVF